jgi:1,5-anhydro-D-fructose reductase (1,5-anhydro-D-mannitol-forming)
MNIVRWGIIGCGDVTEVKSGPGFQKAQGSALVAVMRRDRAKAEDFARRHNVPRVHTRADDLIADGDVDAVYVATPPSTHCELSLKAAAAGKPCLVEKPMAIDHGECLRMLKAFRTAAVPLWVAYYRRALPRYVAVRDLLAGGAIGRVTSVRVEVTDRLASRDQAAAWRFDPAIAGGGLLLDVGSHCVDLLDYLVGEIVEAAGFAVNSGGTYPAEDVTAASFRIAGGVVGTGIWNFNAADKRDSMVFAGSLGELRTPLFHEDDIVVSTAKGETTHPIRNPPHVHQPLIQTIVDELLGRGRCESTGESGARATRVLDLCLGRGQVP